MTSGTAPHTESKLGKRCSHNNNNEYFRRLSEWPVSAVGQEALKAEQAGVPPPHHTPTPRPAFTWTLSELTTMLPPGLGTARHGAEAVVGRGQRRNSRTASSRTGAPAEGPAPR